MRAALVRSIMLMTAVVLVLTVAQSGSATTIAAGLAAVALAAGLAIRYAARVAPSGEAASIRSFAHRQATVAMPAPAHPSTPGRTRSRAPSGWGMAAL